MDSKTSDQKGEYFYKFYPPVLLLLGILAILGFRMAGVVGWSRYILFFFWPVGMVSWLAAIPLKYPRFWLGTYYIIVFWGTCVLISVLTSSIIFRLFDPDADIRQYIIEGINAFLFILIVVLGICQYRHGLKQVRKKEEQQALSSVSTRSD